jgi:hypothetical protein
MKIEGIKIKYIIVNLVIVASVVVSLTSGIQVWGP